MPTHTCECSCCRLPLARIQNGVLIIESRHHGERHTNVIALAELVQLISMGNGRRQYNSQQVESEATTARELPGIRLSSNSDLAT
jgi:hypothetical protein